MLGRAWLSRPVCLLASRFACLPAAGPRHWLKKELLAVEEQLKKLIRKFVNYAKRTLLRVLVTQQPVAQGQVEQTPAHAFEAAFHVSVKEIRVCLHGTFVVFRHSVVCLAELAAGREIGRASCRERV